MNTKRFPLNASKAGNLQLDTHNKFATDQTMRLNYESGTRIFPPSKSSLTPLLLADVQPNPQLDMASVKTSQQLASVSVVSAVVKMLEEMGVKYAFGVSGGAIAPLWHTLQHSLIQVLHFRHKASATTDENRRRAARVNDSTSNGFGAQICGT